jgi:hypothetical protein
LWIAGGVVGVGGVIISDGDCSPSGITSGKLDDRRSGGAYSRERRRKFDVGDGGAREGIEVGGSDIAADADFDRP